MDNGSGFYIKWRNFVLCEIINNHFIKSTQILRTRSDNRVRKFIRWTRLLYNWMRLYKRVSKVVSNVLNIRRRIRHHVQNDSEDEFAPYSVGTAGFIPEVRRPSVKFTIEIHLVPRSRKLGTLPLQQICAFMVWCLCTRTIFMYFIMTPRALCLKWMLPLRL